MIGQRLHSSRAILTLTDQGVVSVGNFAVSILLARFLEPGEYGIFALLLSSFFLAHETNSSLLLYPMTIRIAGKEVKRPKELMATTIGLATVLSGLWATAISVGLAYFGRSDLIFPAVLQLMALQFQEAARRALVAQFFFRTAVIGDAITYLGQAVAVAAIASVGIISLPNALYAMAAMSAAGAVVHLLALGLNFPRSAEPMRVFVDFWQAGKWAFPNVLIVLLRIQIFPWALAAIIGPAATAGFQAILNIANVTNPIVFGLCNAIPQAAAHEKAVAGIKSAWRITRIYALVTAPLILGFCGLVAAFPHQPLGILYGDNSAYLNLEFELQMIMLGVILNFMAEIVGAFFFGVNMGRAALKINLTGLTVALLALPWIGVTGVTGACVGFMVASGFRGLAAWLSLNVALAEKPAANSASKRQTANTGDDR